MRLLLLAPLFLGTLALASDRLEPATAFTTAFEKICEYGEEFEEEALSERTSLCACLKGEPGGKARCRKGGDLELWDRLYLDYLNSEPLEATPTALCVSQLRQRRLSLFSSHLETSCRLRGKETARNSRFVSSAVSIGADCWRFVDLTDDGCLVAKSCDPKGAKLSALGVAGDARLQTRATVCNVGLSATHARKDPEGRTRGYHKPVTQAHLDHVLSPHGEGTYAQANCHGTALMLAGEFLDDVAVTKHYVVPAYAEKCGAETRALYDRARGTKRFPVIGDFDLRHGVAINMVYEKCTPKDCGTAELAVNGCEGSELYSYIFIKDMCIECWSKRLVSVGYSELPADATWTALHRGCLLNQNDHSATVVGSFGGMCTTYESPNPGGPPELKTMPCPLLYARFPRRWCPATPMAFELR